MRKGFGLKYCYNCQAGYHGHCSMSWCSCPLPECQYGEKPVTIIEEVFTFYSTKQTKQPEVKIQEIGKEKVKK